MSHSQLFFFFFFFLFIFVSFLNTATGVITCPTTCRSSGPVVRFPFRLPSQNGRCGYPGFYLSCNNNRTQTMIQLPNSGEFIVQNIDYIAQTMIINDPDRCLPRRFLDKSFSLSGSPFGEQSNSFSFTFLNCSSSDRLLSVSGIRYIDCLSGTNFAVVAVPTYQYNNESVASTSSSCSVISTVSVPVLWPVWSNSLAEGVQLKWKEPDCTSCEERGEICGFKSHKTLDMVIGCANLRRSHGLPRSAKYGIVIGVGIPGLLCFIVLGCYLCGKVGSYRQRHHFTTEFSTAIMPQPAVVLTGLDGPTIESYPKTLIGESGRLLKPNDNTCPICLCEYQPKETLRTIPECKHYIHANCIDEWLRMNATCPLCRKTPDSSAAVTPSTSTSSSSSTSSLLSVP